MRAGARFARLLPVPGLFVMVAAGVRAQRYTPSWFEVDETCINRDPCFSEAESAAVLRSSAWLGWGGLLLVLIGVGLCAWALSSMRRSTPSGPGVAVHAGVSGLVAGPGAVIGLGLGLFGAFMGGLGLVVVVIAWLILAAVLEGLDRALGRARGGRAVYLASLATALVGLVTLGGALAVLGWGVAQFSGAFVLSILSVAAVTALGDVVPAVYVQSWAQWTAAVVAGIAILGAALGGLGLLEPPKVLAAGTWSAVDVPSSVATPPPPARTTLPTPTPTATPVPTPTPAPTPTSVSAQRPCSPVDLTLAVGEFDFAMGARLATVRASNRSESACYLDGFATVRLLQGGQALDLTIATTSSENPGAEVDGEATLVGIAPGHAARLVLYWRGYSQAADPTTPQTLEVTLQPGATAVPLEVPEPRFDLIDGGELRVGNWLPTS